jgi:hypothetical protein
VLGFSPEEAKPKKTALTATKKRTTVKPASNSYIEGINANSYIEDFSG